MQKEFKILGILVLSIVFNTSCNTEIHSNPVDSSEETITEEIIPVKEENLIGDDLRQKLIGSWSTNFQPGQVDLNEDGTYKECEFYNTAAQNAETESCYEGTWVVNEGKVVVIIEEDTIEHSVTWVFDNVVHFGDENLDEDQEMAWENGMTKI